MAPKNPSMIATQIPVGKGETAPFPLNGTKELVGDAAPVENEPPIPPPVRFAPLGYKK